MIRNNSSDNVVLVNSNDIEVGVMPKLEAHQKGVLHRAFSVFLFNANGQVLLQQRAVSKYHSPNLWSNTCCSHPLPGESTKNAAERRLFEEMGITSELNRKFSFIYNVKLDNDLTEHELDHVFFGNFEGSPNLNKDEVQNWKYMSLDDLEIDIQLQPQNYTAWLKICLDKVINHFKKLAA